jgi:hypothetical protein
VSGKFQKLDPNLAVITLDYSVTTHSLVFRHLIAHHTSVTTFKFALHFHELTDLDMSFEIFEFTGPVTRVTAI